MAADHLATKAVLRAAGLPATLLRNGWYSKTHTGGLGGLAAGAPVGWPGAGRTLSRRTRRPATPLAETLARAVAALGSPHRPRA